MITAQSPEKGVLETEFNYMDSQSINHIYIMKPQLKKKKLWAPQLSNTLAIFSHFNNGRVIHPEDKESFTF